MHKVFKYKIKIKDYFSLVFPQGARILSVQVQYGKPQLWALVNPHNTVETRNFLLIDTGEQIENNLERLDYIGTFQLDDGEYVGHLFEIR
jgi:hypothetical protein